MGGLNPGTPGTQVRDFDNGHIFLTNADGTQTSDSTCDAASLKSMIAGVDAGGIVSNSLTWTNVQGTLDHVAAQLHTAIGIIQQHWHSGSADDAATHLASLRDTSSSLAGNSTQMGSGLERIGSAIETAQSTGVSDANAGAVYHTMKEGINTGLSHLPTQVMWNVPTAGSPGPGPGPGPGVGGPGPGVGGPGPGVGGPGSGGGPGIPHPPHIPGPGTGGPGSGGPGSGGPGSGGPGSGGPGTGGHAYSGPGGDASIPGPGVPGSGGGGPGFSGPGPGATGSSLAGFAPGGPGGPGGGVGGGLGGGLGAGGGLSGATGAGTSSGMLGIGAAPVAGASGAGSRGGMMAPMSGRPGGGDDDERERSTWLNEDDDIWGVSDAAPPIIGR